MVNRSIASLSLTFGLVSIPVKLYAATGSSAPIRFKLMASSGARLRQQYVAADPPLLAGQEPAVVQDFAAEEPVVEVEEPPPEAQSGRMSEFAAKVVDFPAARLVPPPSQATQIAQTDESVIDRSSMVKGYEFEKGKFVLFTPEELKALKAASRQTVDIVSFIPENAIDPIYYDKAYFLAPDKRGAKPYSLLLRAMRDTGRCALAKWAFRSKEYVAQVRVADGGLVLQQLFYVEEVRSMAGLHIELVDVRDAELSLAKQLIEQISADSYDPTQFVDEEKERILAAVAAKVAGEQIKAPAQAGGPGQVIDLLEALRASLQPTQGAHGTAKTSKLERKPVKRATGKSLKTPAAPLKARGRKR